MSAKSITNRIAVVTLVSLLGVGTSVAQSTYGYGSGPVGPVYTTPGAWGYGAAFRASTAAQGLLNGSAALTDAMGTYELNDGQAGILREQARSMDRENDLQQTEALQAQKKMWADARIQARKDREARAAEGQQLLSQRRATIYRQAYQLSTSDLNLKTGAIAWPVALKDARFQENRAQLEELFHQYVGYGSPEPRTAGEIARSVDQWARTLRNESSTMPREDYVAAQKFLLGLKYGAESVSAT